MHERVFAAEKSLPTSPNLRYKSSLRCNDGACLDKVFPGRESVSDGELIPRASSLPKVTLDSRVQRAVVFNARKFTV